MMLSAINAAICYNVSFYWFSSFITSPPYGRSCRIIIIIPFVRELVIYKDFSVMLSRENANPLERYEINKVK